MQHKSLAKILVICTCKFGYSFASKTENGAFFTQNWPPVCEARIKSSLNYSEIEPNFKSHFLNSFVMV